MDNPQQNKEDCREDIDAGVEKLMNHVRICKKWRYNYFQMS